MRVLGTLLTAFIVQTVFCQINGGFETNDVDGCRNATGNYFEIILHILIYVEEVQIFRIYNHVYA